MTRDQEMARWISANPWILQNTQNGDARCGRFPTREAAVAEANLRGGVVAVEGQRVLFSEMPRL